MSEWWSYGLSDFLMFSPQAYWRLVARYNQACWPAQWLGLGAVLAMLFMLLRPARGAATGVLLLAAAAWAWVGWGFHRQRYAEIFLGAPWVAAACALQALLLLAAIFGPRTEGAGNARAAGSALLALALLFPLLAPLQGRGWNEAEVFGFMPDPTALATLGALAMLPRPAWLRVALAVLPLLSLLLGTATRWLLA